MGGSKDPWLFTRDNALTTARTELPKIEGQEAFADARSELATILPDIMEGFADQATEAQAITESQKFLDLIIPPILWAAVIPDKWGTEEPAEVGSKRSNILK